VSADDRSVVLPKFRPVWSACLCEPFAYWDPWRTGLWHWLNRQ